MGSGRLHVLVCALKVCQILLRGVQRWKLHSGRSRLRVVRYGEDDAAAAAARAVAVSFQPVQLLAGGEVAEQLVRARRAVHGQAQVVGA